MLQTITRRLMRWSLRSPETAELGLGAVRRLGPRHAPDLATTLLAVAARRAEAGMADAALAAIGEAVDIYRRSPAPGLARALHLRMVVLCSVGRAEEALADADEAAALFARSADASLADFLRTHGACLARCGQVAAAVPVASRAVVLRRRLVASSPAEQQQELGDALINLSALLVRLGHHEQAARIATEAVLVWRRLVTVRTEPILAVALLHLGASLTSTRPAEGLRAADEAISLLQGRLDDPPGRHEEYLLRARLVRDDCLARLDLPA